MLRTILAGVAVVVLAWGPLMAAGAQDATMADPGALTAEIGPDPRPHFKVGRPYRIGGKLYRPAFVSDYQAVGAASWYGEPHHGRPTANGEIYDMHALTAAHPRLPLPSVVEVTNLANGKSLVLRVNDPGPFVMDRLIDLSRAAARELGFQRQQLTDVRVRYLGIARLGEKPIRPGDRRKHAAIQ